MLRMFTTAAGFFVVFLSQIAFAQSQSDVLLKQFLEDVQTLSGRFEQQIYSADDELQESSEGMFAVERPGRFHWMYQSPYEQLVLADGLNVWSYDADLEQVTVTPQAEVLENTPATLLSGTQRVEDEFETIDSFTDRGTEWLVLKPRNSENGFVKLELGFTDQQLSRMVFSDNLGQSTLLALYDVEYNEPQDESLFSFDVPDGVDVIGERITALQESDLP